MRLPCPQGGRESPNGFTSESAKSTYKGRPSASLSLRKGRAPHPDPLPARAGRGSRKLPLHKLLAPIALCIEQRGEIAVIDARGRGLRHQRLGSEGDAQAGIADH